eukprot:CAMPEP_0197836132 /NCGR_PEP_ID=MMETSP1437-20131217/28080_1 /TAXON_ID=49252 ORGANISM="Eucampia antarctica, Strain CCMP1452" /NCGR_SAMPLE_ID=MMETSP1437 /ASSEMBLY_ACC=CAM_ASM_001096 /LENGTH=497 /DNA_ID=CAMNT_0043442081 /DNA_START=381 /DNA_END=1874 /DNA_ORIENTATION=+
MVQFMRNTSFSEIKDEVVQLGFEFASENIPMVKNELKKEMDKMEKTFQESKPKDRVTTRYLPKEGRDTRSILIELKTKADRENAKWENGMVSGTVYSGEKSLTELSNMVYSIYSLSNPLHADIWPTISQCEAEVISMTAGLVNGGDEGVVGATSSGGTESIILAVRAHLEVYGRKRGICHPEIVCCTTAHAALNKACQMFHIRQVQIPCDMETFELNANEVEKYITSNTIMIYSSAPNFPQGVIDPIEDLSDLAQTYHIGLHVDACLGGFVLPFAAQMGYSIPRFDFSCPGVTSMSLDTHKFGYASKGTSVVLYRNKTLRRSQYFNFSKWPGGLYSTPTIAGSRSGALLASAWASMVTIGENGYKRRVKLILDAAKEISRALEKIEGLKLLGDTPAMIVCFGSDEFDIYRVADFMTHKGWSLNSLQYPACVHLCLTIQTSLHKEKFITDLVDAVDNIRQSSGGKASGNAAIYGMAGSMPAGPINDLLSLYTDNNLSL